MVDSLAQVEYFLRLSTCLYGKLLNLIRLHHTNLVSIRYPVTICVSNPPAPFEAQYLKLKRLTNLLEIIPHPDPYYIKDN